MFLILSSILRQSCQNKAKGQNSKLAVFQPTFQNLNYCHNIEKMAKLKVGNIVSFKLQYLKNGKTQKIQIWWKRIF